MVAKLEKKRSWTGKVTEIVHYDGGFNSIKRTGVFMTIRLDNAVLFEKLGLNQKVRITEV